MTTTAVPRSTPGTRPTREPGSSGRSLLIVATVASTIHGFLVPYATHFRGLGWRVDAAAKGAPADQDLVDHFDHVFELPMSRSIRDVGALIRGIRAIGDVLDTQPEIVHVHTPIAAFLTRLMVRRMPAVKRPAVAYTAHGFHFHQGGSRLTNAVFLTLERISGRWTDRLVVINDEDYEAAQRHRIVSPRRLVRMPGIGVDTERYSRVALDPAEIARVRSTIGRDPDAPLFVAVGELSQRKRMMDVVSALALMRHTEARLAIAGTGPQQAGIESLIDSLGVKDRVHLAGHVADVRPLIANGIGLILASSREGLPRAIMEGMSLEVAAIGSTARGNGELIDDETGIMFPTGDVAALAAAMDRFVDEPAEAREMGRRGRARMVERYDLRKVIELHEVMYRAMLGERSARR